MVPDSPADSESPPAVSVAHCPRCLRLTPFDTLEESSPIPSDLFTTNRPPLDSEILSIQNVITERRAQKSLLDTRISVLEASLKKLMADRDSLEETIWAHEGTLSPLRRMPTELLSSIFALTRPSGTREDPAPWIVGQVCRHWRAIVSSQPSLWASIVLDFGESTLRRTATEYKLETRLQRSRNLPLDIAFSCHDTYSRYTDQELGLLKILAKHCARWRKISISGPFSLYSELACIRGHLPLLQDLEVFSYLPVDEAPSTDVFELAPNLQCASVNMRGGGATVLLPFVQLQRYFARTWYFHLDALRSPNLVECVLEIDSISAPPTPIILLPQLLRLCSLTSNILEYLDTPNLQELYCPSQADYLSSLFRRRPYRLRKLVVFFPASVTDLRGILHSVPTITEMGLSIPAESTGALVDLLSIRNETTDVGHTLASITICFKGSATGTFGLDHTDLLVDMVESRWRGGSGQLRSITVPEVRYYLDWDERLELFRAQGLEIQFSTSSSQTHLDMIPSHLQLDYSSNL
ncbi:hypothetical protein C8R44DRAFT_707808 [Mycena epipterygia]|nr:hypothetical protein C8R44DRAFT_707808 [Mycena epipterygia]